MHVEGRPHCVDLASESFSDSDRVFYRNHNLKLVIIIELIVKALNVVEPELCHVDSMTDPVRSPLSVRLHGLLQEFVAALFLFEERIAPEKELDLDVTPDGWGIILIGPKVES